MDKLDKIIAEFLSVKYDREWKPYLTETERKIFVLYYFKKYSIIQISLEVHYSDRQVKRKLKDIRNKINELIP